MHVASAAIKCPNFSMATVIHGNRDVQETGLG